MGDYVNLTTGGAVAATLFANFLFAFWYQGLKHLGKYPLAGFTLWLYISSFITMCLALIVLGPNDMPNGIGAELHGRWGLAAVVATGGMVMTIGLIVSLIHMKNNGMVANQAITGFLGSIVNLVLTFVVGGLPERISLKLVLLSAAVLLVASIICQYSTTIKDTKVIKSGKEAGKRQGRQGSDSLIKQNIVLIISMILLTGYSVSYMVGTRTELRPDAFPPLLCVFILSIGSLLGAVSYGLIVLIPSGKFREVFFPGKKLPIFLGLGSGICHYGGNLLLIYALPLVSAPVSMLLSKTSSIWTYAWGIVYGEYKGASIKSKITLIAGIVGYIIGVLMLTNTLYS
jgi:drug/metabolite transporter (DMT)-like permease